MTLVNRQSLDVLIICINLINSIILKRLQKKSDSKSI